MKVKHSWLHTATMRCDLVMTIKWCGNAPEYDDLSALSRSCVFFKTNVASDNTVLHEKNSYLDSFFGNQTMTSRHSCFYCARYKCQDHCMHHLLAFDVSPFAGKQPAECKGRNSLLVLAKKMLG